MKTNKTKTDINLVKRCTAFLLGKLFECKNRNSLSPRLEKAVELKNPPIGGKCTLIRSQLPFPRRNDQTELRQVFGLVHLNLPLRDSAGLTPASPFQHHASGRLAHLNRYCITMIVSQAATSVNE